MQVCTTTITSSDCQYVGLNGDTSVEYVCEVMIIHVLNFVKIWLFAHCTQNVFGDGHVDRFL